MEENDLGLKTFSSAKERGLRENLTTLAERSPIPSDEILDNLGLFVTSKLLSRLLFLHHIYLLQVGIHGVIMDFGTRWGQNMAIFNALRGIYEPFNRHRKIIGFDTFAGFPETGKYGVTAKYEEFLEEVLSCQEELNPGGHMRKYEIVKGDVTRTLLPYLSKHQEILVSLAYFDMDLQVPTSYCLNHLLPRMCKGSVIAFDELCDETFPGETEAFLNYFGNKVRARRLPITSRTSYIILE